MISVKEQVAHAGSKPFRPYRAVVRAVDAYPYSLPKGLPGGAEVTVVSYDLKTYNYVVRDAAGARMDHPGAPKSRRWE